MPARDAQADASEDDTFWGGRNAKFSSEPQRIWFERMRDKGWTVPHWPKEYGGGGLDGEEAKILRQEMAAIGARKPLTSFGISMLGPALLKYGTEEQKREHLPKIAAARSAGARAIPSRMPAPISPRCRPAPRATATITSSTARRSGPPTPTRPTGSSAWCAPIPPRRSMTASASSCSTWRRQGVSTKPILLISGYSPFCETFFDNVRVPKSHVVGTVNRGWDVAKYLLQHEREMISGMGERGVGRPLGQIAADSIGSDAQGRLDDAAAARARSRRFDVDEAALAAAAERAVDLAKAGQAHPAFPSAMKYYGTELNKRRYELLMSAGGIDALEWESERSREGARPRAWLRTKANSIEGGTSEVQLGIVAKRILDLPGA